MPQPHRDGKNTPTTLIIATEAMNPRLLPLIAIPIFIGCVTPNRTDVPTKTPSQMLGLFRVCGPYACSYIEVQGDGRYEMFGTGENRWHRNMGTWVPVSAACLRLSPSPMMEQETILHTPKLSTQLRPKEDWCLENGKHILHKKSGNAVEFDPVPRGEEP